MVKWRGQYAADGLAGLEDAAPDECFFSVITRQAIRRGFFTSVKEITATIGVFIDTWNKHPMPFTWIKDAGEILAKMERAKTKAKDLTDHERWIIAWPPRGVTAI